MEPSADQVRGQLDRLLSSAPFASADRISRFLRYVVERTLAGEGDQLKEYAVGIAVFDRGEQYDPRVDSIVRVEAGRLRAKIDEYYRSADGIDPVVIRLPKGSYVPVFELRQPAAVAAPAGGPLPTSSRRWWLVGGLAGALLVALALWRPGLLGLSREAAAPTIAVLPFEVFSNDADQQLLAARLTDGVTSALARLGTLGVVSRTSARQAAGLGRPLREVAQSLGATVLLEARVEINSEAVLVEARLIDGVADRKIWVEAFTGQIGNLPDLERRIASAANAATPRR